MPCPGIGMGRGNMPDGRRSHRTVPNLRKLTIIAQDPSVKVGGKILLAEVEVPAEELLPGPSGHRVKVIDYDASTNTLYQPASYPANASGTFTDPFRMPKRRTRAQDRKLLGDPRF